jgi:hypothetical protein
MNSFNHYSFGSVCEWFYRVILGINFDESQPGYKHFYVKPQPGGTLTSAEGSYRSISGTIRSKWNIGTNGVYALSVSVPANTTADICIPRPDDLDQWMVRERGGECWQSGAYVEGVEGITAATDQGECIAFSAGSGEYTFWAGPQDLVRARAGASAVISLTRFFYNPVSGITRINYAVSNANGAAEHVTVRAFDLRGVLVAELVDAAQTPGAHTVVWKGNNRFGQRLAEGTYVIRLQVGAGKCITKKLVMLRQ